jgi:hypothetical protein
MTGEGLVMFLVKGGSLVMFLVTGGDIVFSVTGGDFVFSVTGGDLVRFSVTGGDLVTTTHRFSLRFLNGIGSERRDVFGDRRTSLDYYPSVFLPGIFDSERRSPFRSYTTAVEYLFRCSDAKFF